MKKLHLKFPIIVQSLIAAVLFLLLPDSLWCESKADRFFLMGDSRLHIRNTKTGAEVDATILSPDGSLNEEGLSQIDQVFGFDSHRTEEHISLRTLFMLDYFSDLVAPGKVINVESGYRSPEYNTKLRNAGGNVAKTSTHIDGMALDFNIEGVDGKELWNLIKDRDCCGIGHYGGQNVHLDSGKPRFWEASTSKVTTGESDLNRRIYLSTDYDRYKPGEQIQLSFSSVSNFGFGVKRVLIIVGDSSYEDVIARMIMRSPADSDCLMIGDRDASHSMFTSLPEDLISGFYRIKLDFCDRPFEEMPETIVSNKIEIIRN